MAAESSESKFDHLEAKNSSSEENDEELQKITCGSKNGSEEEIESKKVGAKSASLFSEEDDIILLEEMIKFNHQTKSKTKTDWVMFRQVVQGKLSREFTRTQISEKFRRLKANMEKDKSCVNLEGNEGRILELSRSLWPHTTPSKPRRKRRRERELVSPGVRLEPSEYPHLEAFFNDTADCVALPYVVRKSWMLMGSEAAEKLEYKLDSLLEREICLNIERAHFSLEAARLVLEQINH